MIRLAVGIIANSLAFWLSERYIAGVVIEGNWRQLLAIGAVLALLNWAVKPLLKLIATPLIIITFGLFILAINGLLIWITDALFPFFTIETFTALIWTTILLGVINALMSFVYKIVK